MMFLTGFLFSSCFPQSLQQLAITNSKQGQLFCQDPGFSDLIEVASFVVALKQLPSCTLAVGSHIFRQFLHVKQILFIF